MAVFKTFKLILMQEKVLNSKDLFCIKETLFNIGRGGLFLQQAYSYYQTYNQLLISCVKHFFSLIWNSDLYELLE